VKERVAQRADGAGDGWSVAELPLGGEASNLARPEPAEERHAAQQLELLSHCHGHLLRPGTPG